MTRSWLSILLAGLAAFAVGCDCSGAPGPCESADPPDGCGEPCSFSAPCPDGLYCGAADVCTADCGPDVPCPEGSTCAPAGHCVAVADGASVMDARPALDAPLPDNTCASVDFTATGTTPNVILVVDRSLSMDTRFSSRGSRWVVLRDSLLATDGLLSTLQPSVRFGLVLYTTGSGGGGSCPDLITVPAALDNYDAIATEYRMHGPGLYTPTGDAISAVLGRLGELAPVRSAPTILVLATDGEPNSCEMRGTSSEAYMHGRMESLAAVDAAFDMDIRTYVISVGTDVGEDHLQDIANAGLGRGGSDPDAPFWVATDTGGLEAALSEIIGGVVSCTLELSGEIDPALACLGTVRLGGDLLTCDDPDGWRAVDSTHIELTGAACERLQTGGESVNASFPCAVIII